MNESLGRWVHFLKRLPFRLSGYLGSRLLRRLAHLSPPRLVWILKRLRPFFWIADRSLRAYQPVLEVIDVLENDPRGRDGLLRMLRETSLEQTGDLLKGVLRHQVTLLPTPSLSLTGRDRPARVRGGAARIVVIGSCAHLTLRREGLERQEGAIVHSSLESPGELSQSLRGEADAYEISGQGVGFTRLIEDLLREGEVVSTDLASVPSVDALSSWLGIAEAHFGVLRIALPWLHYPPLERLKTMLEMDEIGALAHVRIRATLGGSGGRFEPQVPEGLSLFSHDTFDHFALLTWLGGPIAALSAMSNAIETTRGGAAVVSVKFKAPRRYGVLEMAYAPGLSLRSRFWPLDLELEASGSSGILRLTRSMAERGVTPPLLWRVADQTISIGSEAGLHSDFSLAYDGLARELLEIVHGNLRFRLPVELLACAIRARSLVKEAVEERRVMTI